MAQRLSYDASTKIPTMVSVLVVNRHFHKFSASCSVKTCHLRLASRSDAYHAYWALGVFCHFLEKDFVSVERTVNPLRRGSLGIGVGVG